MKVVINLIIIAAMVILIVAAISRVTLVPILGVESRALLILVNTLLLIGITLMLLEQQKK